MRMPWIPCKYLMPKSGVLVDTKVLDDGVTSHHRPLMMQSGNKPQWFDGNYLVFYSPTHWRKV